MEQELAGRTAIVTGASSGIGTASAEALAAAGANVVLVGRDAERLERARQRVSDAGPEALAVRVDLTEDDAPQAVVDAAIEGFGGIDVLVHSAGLFSPLPFASAGVGNLDQHWAVNVRAPYALTHAAGQHLGDGAAVVFLSSSLGAVAAEGMAAYCMTKAAVEMMARALSTEFGQRGVRVNCVAPGYTVTPMTEATRADPVIGGFMRDRVDARRWGQPEEVAAGVVFLASQRAAFVHGHVLRVDGGWTTH